MIPWIIILLMEAIILGSRSGVQDKFFQKDLDEKYKKHQDTIKTISKEKLLQFKGWEKEI